MTYPESSATSFSFAASTSENYFTGNTSTGNGNDSTGNGNDSTGNGNNNSTGTKEATKYREFGQDLIAQQLTSTNVDSFALITASSGRFIICHII